MSNGKTASVNTTEQFDEMIWHDCPIYAFYIDDSVVDLVLDLDYIVDWIAPKMPGHPYQHYIAPATLAFHSAHDIRIELQSAAEPLLIDAISRAAARPYQHTRHTEYHWTIECHNGIMSFHAVGFTQYLRAAPILCDRQRLDFTGRGGVSFSRTTFDGQ